MSDIRFNQWLHNSGTGGVSQVDGGHVGIGTTNPLIPVGAGVTAILNVGVVTANYYYGDGDKGAADDEFGAGFISEPEFNKRHKKARKDAEPSGKKKKKKKKYDYFKGLGDTEK